MLVSLLVCQSASAVVTIYTNFNQWKTTIANSFTTATFVGYPAGTFITTQYVASGFEFLDGNDNTYYTQSFVNDGVGIDGNSSITIQFTTPMTAIAVHFPGHMRFDLYNQGRLFYSSISLGGGGTGLFAGLVSTQVFDRVVLKGIQATNVDDLHFGPPIPLIIGDMNADGVVGPFDLAQLLSQWGRCDNPFNCPADFTGDDIIGPADLAQLLAHWGGK
jgi:hypothetical protein